MLKGRFPLFGFWTLKSKEYVSERATRARKWLKSIMSVFKSILLRHLHTYNSRFNTSNEVMFAANSSGRCPPRWWCDKSSWITSFEVARGEWRHTTPLQLSSHGSLLGSEKSHRVALGGYLQFDPFVESYSACNAVYCLDDKPKALDVFVKHNNTSNCDKISQIKANEMIMIIGEWKWSKLKRKHSLHY